MTGARTTFSAWRRAAAVVAFVAIAGACTAEATSPDSAAVNEPTSTDRSGEASTTTDDAAPVSSSNDTSSTEAPTTTTSTTTTTEPPRFFDEACVVEVMEGDSLDSIVNRFDDGETGNRVTVRAENGLVDELVIPGQIIDVCPGNGLNDETGEQRLDADPAIVDAALTANVEAQQLKLNELFTPFGTRELAIDGIDGPVTRQHLCAARLSLGFEPTTAEMLPGSEEERALFAATSLVPPPVATTDQDRWALIDQTCQFMFVGAVAELVFAFPTSTGQDGFETRNNQRQRAFRFDPAFDSGGWHDSSEFPVSIDNPLNGNMYKPIYFDGGQAIHGANNVPTSPQSKGCARLSVAHQDLLVNWLGLAGDTAPTWSERALRFTVSVQGDYVD